MRSPRPHPAAFAVILFLVAAPLLRAGFTTSGTNLLNGSISIGRNGTGSAVLDGGTVLNTYGALTLGSGVTGSGEMLITGGGTQFLSIGGSLFAGRSGTGVLTIADGAHVGPMDSSVQFHAFIGYNVTNSPPGIGTVNVQGHGTLLQNYFMFVGRNGTGTLNISDGAHVTNLFTSVTYDEPSRGALNITGTGSRLDTEYLIVGNDYNTTGTMDVGDHATVAVSRDGMQLGAVADSGRYSNGSMTVHDGGNLLVTGTMFIGESGIGTADFRSGAQVTADATTFGNVAGATGTLQVRGTGTLFIAGAVQLGIDGTGTLELKDGGKVRAASFLIGAATGSGTLRIGAGGAAGMLDTNEVTGGTGAAELVFDHTDTTGAYAFTNDAGNGIALGGHVAITHDAGTTTFTAASTTDGGLTVNGGTVVAGHADAFGTGGIAVNGGVFDTGTYALANSLEANAGTITGTGTLGGSASFAAGTHLAPGHSAGTLTFANGLYLSADMILDFELGTASDLVRVSGGTLGGPGDGTVMLNLTNAGGFGAGTYVLFDFTGAELSDFDVTDFSLGATLSGYDYSFNLNATSLTLTAATAIPEPSTYAALAGIAALGLAFVRRLQQLA